MASGAVEASSPKSVAMASRGEDEGGVSAPRGATPAIVGKVSPARASHAPRPVQRVRATCRSDRASSSMT